MSVLSRQILLLSSRSSSRMDATRTFSTAAAALEDEQLDEVRRRPRLEALREELKNEKTPVVFKNKKKKPAAVSKNNTLDDLRHELSLLPAPQKMLVDKFQRQHSYLRLSLVEKCNLRCQYCMPPEGVPLQPAEHLLKTSELLKLTKIFCKGGVDKIRLTGGEPLLRSDLADIIAALKDFSSVKQIGMTTNGVTLSKHISNLHKVGLTHVNISLDTLDPIKFQKLTRRNAFQKVWKSIETACNVLPEGRVKINVVVMRGCNDEEIQDFCFLTKQLPVDVRFIEYMPFFDNGWKTGLFVSYKEMLESTLSLKRIEDGPNDTTKWWKLPNSSRGRIGFITSMSQHFCGTCNRLRLTADGKIKACLFGSSEISLRDALRDASLNQEDLTKLIHYAVQRKTFALGGHGSAQGIAEANDNRPMTLIGG